MVEKKQNKSSLPFNLPLTLFIVLLLVIATLAFISIQQRLNLLKLLENPKETKAATTHIQSKVLVAIFNPIIESRGNQKLTNVIGWSDPDTLTQQYIDELGNVSNGGVSYSVGQRLEIDDFPQLQDKFDYTDESYLACVNDNSKCDLSSTVDYQKVFTDLRVCDRLNAGGMNEVWFFTPPFTNFYEWNVTGPSLNLYQNNIPNCGKTIYVMGFNYERTVTEMIHDFGHRTEIILLYGVYTNLTDPNNPWNKFDGQWYRYNYSIGQPQPPVQTTGTHCGNVHFPPNSNVHYGYDSSLYVSSDCDNWYNYPNLVGAAKQINCSTWGCNEKGYLEWWLKHLPKADGQTNGKFNNWWRYLVDWDNSLPKVTAAVLANTSTSCNSQGKVNTRFFWTKATATGKTIDAQWLDLSLYNNNFASGTFVSTNNPPYSSDTSYTTGAGLIGPLDSGKTNYWRINTHFYGDPSSLWYPSATGMFTTPTCVVAVQSPTPTPTPTPTSTTSCSNFSIASLTPNPVQIGGQVTVTISSSPSCSGKIAWIVGTWNNSWFSCAINSSGSCTKILTAPTSAQAATLWAALDMNGDGIYDTDNGTYSQKSEYRFAVLTVFTSTTPTPTPTVQIKPAQVQNPSQKTCNSQGKVSVSFSWTKATATGKTIDAQWLDLSLYNNNFASGTFVSTNNPPYSSDTSYTTGAGLIGPLDSGKTHYWRINTHFSGDPSSLWYPSATGMFTAINCPS